MKQALKNIFKKAELKTSWGVVKKRLSRDRLELIDQVGRTRLVEVEPGSFYPPGSNVALQDGKVIGPAGVAGKVKKVMV